VTATLKGKFMYLVDDAAKDAAGFNWSLLLGNLTVGLAIAFVSAFLTVRLAFKRFYSEKQWERKADAYTKLFIALHRLKTHSAHELHLVEDGDSLPQGEQFEVERRAVMDRLEDDMLSGLADLQLQIDIGTFAITEEAVHLLKKHQSSLGESIDMWKRDQNLTSHFEHKVRSVDACLEELRKIAKSDLSKGWR
jgi:hypothetical protein